MLYLLLSVPLPAATLTIENPSFENGADAPNAWEPLTKYLGHRYLWESETVHSGTRSLSTRATRYRYGRWKSDPAPVQNDSYTWYTLSGFVKTARNNGAVCLSIA